MGRSAGPGSPVRFKCWAQRRGERGDRHEVQLTGRRREYHPKRMAGTRSSWWEREYVCSCGHVGWSNHRDLEVRVDGQAEID